MTKTENVTKVYRNGFKSVDGLNLQVSEGDIFGFLGPNGAGKTTTIRMLTGLLQPTGGKLLVNGLDVAKQAVEVKQVIGVVPESHGYYWMNPVEYLTYFGALFGMDGKEIAVKTEYLLQKVGLGAKKKVPIGQFSRRMKQRLGLAKIPINGLKVIFLYGPTLGLDHMRQRDVQNLILDINRTEKITVFITSHLLKDADMEDVFFKATGYGLDDMEGARAV